MAFLRVGLQVVLVAFPICRPLEETGTGTREAVAQEESPAERDPAEHEDDERERERAGEERQRGEDRDWYGE